MRKTSITNERTIHALNFLTNKSNSNVSVCRSVWGEAIFVFREKNLTVLGFALVSAANMGKVNALLDLPKTTIPPLSFHASEYEFFENGDRISAWQLCLSGSKFTETERDDCATRLFSALPDSFCQNVNWLFQSAMLASDAGLKITFQNVMEHLVKRCPKALQQLVRCRLCRPF